MTPPKIEEPRRKAASSHGATVRGATDGGATVRGPNRRNRSVAAFTLLEVVLTLSMTVVLMMLIGGAIRLYVREMDTAQLVVRDTQLAAAVMQMIEDDLRATLHTEPADTAPLEELLASVAGGGGSSPAEEEDLSAAGFDAPEEESETTVESSSSINLQSSAAVLQSPGLIGNQYQIQIDLSRLPRLEEYVAMLDETTGDLDDVPSDIKTVAYYIQPPGFIGGVQDRLAKIVDTEGSSEVTAEINGGLVRRSLDRAATVEAAMTGGLSRLNQSGEILAPEITGIEFTYWDGVTWLPQWSSDEYGELPYAVQVVLTVADRSNPSASDSLLSAAEPEVRAFKHIIRLPLARPVEEFEDDGLSEVGL